MNDEQLIRAYVEEGSEEAFVELIQRHAGLVYGTAMRQVGSPELAQELAQQVFCALAAQAPKLRDASSLPAWLHRTTRQRAALHFRTEGRRTRREHQAYLMSTNEPQTPSWTETEPLLDEALESLPATDRNALLIRYFHGQPLAVVGEQLGTTEAAAKMRISRAVEKLRVFFKERGLIYTAAGLALALEENAAAAVAPGVVQGIVAASARPARQLLGRGTSALKPSSAVRWAGAVCVVFLGVVALLPFIAPKPEPPADLISTPVKPASSELRADSVSPEQVRSNSTPSSPEGLMLRVVDSETLQPLANVSIRAGNLGRLITETVTDASGSAQVGKPGAVETDFYYRIRARAAGYVTTDVSWSRFQHDQIDDLPLAYTIQLKRGLRIGGFVRNEEGAGVPNARVELRTYSATSDTPRERSVLSSGGTESALTNPEGKWEIDSADEHWTGGRLIVLEHGYLKAEYSVAPKGEAARSILPQELLSGTAQLTLERGLALKGQVVDASGIPIRAATVYLNHDFRDESNRRITDEAGLFSFQVELGAKAALTARADGFAVSTVEMKERVNRATITLIPGGQMNGKVVDDAGNGIAGAWVEGPDQSHANVKRYVWETRTDDQGSFIIESAPSEPTVFTVTAAGYESQKIKLSAGGEFATVALTKRVDPGNIEIQGIIRNAETLAPVAEFAVFLSDEVHQSEPTLTGHDGKFSVSVRRDAHHRIVRVAAEGFEPTSFDWDSNAPPTEPLIFNLKPASGWWGVVTLPNGNPAAGAMIALATSERRLIIGNRQIQYTDQAIWVRASADGKFHMPPRAQELAKGRFIVAAHEDGYAEWPADEYSVDLNLQLQPWSRVSGRITINGKAVRDERLTLQRRFYNPWVSGVHLMGKEHKITTGANGSFVFDSLPHGRYAVSFAGSDVLTTFELLPGQSLRLPIELKRAEVSGKVAFSEAPTSFDWSATRGILKRKLLDPVDLPRLRRDSFPTQAAFDEASLTEADRLIGYWNSKRSIDAWMERRSHPVNLRADGTFTLPSVAPGDYFLQLHERLSVDSRGMPSAAKRVLPGRGLVGEIHVGSKGESIKVGIVQLNPPPEDWSWW